MPLSLSGDTCMLGGQPLTLPLANWRSGLVLYAHTPRPQPANQPRLVANELHRALLFIPSRVGGEWLRADLKRSSPRDCSCGKISGEELFFRNLSNLTVCQLRIRRRRGSSINREPHFDGCNCNPINAAWWGLPSSSHDWLVVCSN